MNNEKFMWTYHDSGYVKEKTDGSNPAKIAYHNADYLASSVWTAEQIQYNLIQLVLTHLQN